MKEVPLGIDAAVFRSGAWHFRVQLAAFAGWGDQPFYEWSHKPTDEQAAGWVEVAIPGERGVPISLQQRDAYGEFAANQAMYAERVLAALHAEYIAPGGSFEDFPTSQDLKCAMLVEGIWIHRPDASGVCDVAVGLYGWDDEHHHGVRFRNGEVIETGGCDVAFVEYE